eukprot:11786045-Alexandrium_andersonii.AAC.1
MSLGLSGAPGSRRPAPVRATLTDAVARLPGDALGPFDGRQVRDDPTAGGSVGHRLAPGQEREGL